MCGRERRRRRALIGWVLAALMPASASALTVEGERAGFDLLTHARTYSLLLFDAGADARRATLIEAGVDPDAVPGTAAEQAAVVERFRFALDAWAGERWSASVHYELLPIFGALGADGLVTTVESPLRRWDFDRTLRAGDGWTLSHGLDRAVLRGLFGGVEVRLGRQAIGFGGARLFDAADLFAPLGPAAIDNEFKAGVDGLHLLAPLGERHELGLVAVLHRDDWTDGMLLGRWQGAFAGFDAALLAGMTYGAPTAALAVAGDIGGPGAYLDASVRHAAGESIVRATAGVDHYFATGIRLMGELHYNGAGADEPADFPTIREAAPYRRGEVFLLGEFYAGGLAMYEVHPLVNISLSWLQSLTDGSALAGPALSWDFAQEVTLAAGALVPVGERMTLGPGLTPAVGSEFGLYPLVVFTDVRLAL